MKRLVLSALFVSVFLIGVSSLIDSASASLRSDEKAMALIRTSRAAIGGDQNLAEVKSMSIKGTTTHFREKAGVQDVQTGSMEINFELPGKFSKRVMIGEPGAGESDAIVEKDVEVIGGSGSGDGNENVFVIRKGDADDIDWTAKSDGKVSVDGDTITVRRDDGSVEKIKGDGKHKVIVRSGGGGENIDIVGPEDEDVNVFETDDGKRIVVKGGHGGGAHGASNEMLRTTLALLMKTPDDGSVDFKFEGQGNVDGFASNIIDVIDVESGHSTFKIYLDAATNLPQMISYPVMHHRRMKYGKGTGEMKERVLKSEEMPKTAHTREIKFSDFRSVGGLLLPYRWTESSGGKTLQFIDITGYEINPANIDERFGNDDSGEGVRIIKKRVENN